MKQKAKNETHARRLVRLQEVLELIPISRSTWLEGVRAGKYPKPVKLGSRITAWRLGDVLQLTETGLQELSQKELNSSQN